MKKLMMGAAACALLFSSCSKNELSDINPSNPNAISFMATTTRASVNNLDSMKSDTDGFKVYATSGSSPTGWYTNVDGSNNYKFSTAWGWALTTSTPTWPVDAADYPLNFYAFYPESATGFNPTATPSSAAVSAEITIQKKAADQVDFLAAKATAFSKPGDGKLALTFNHILSKVNFGIIAGNGATVYVQSIRVVNVKNEATYSYVAGTWVAYASSVDTFAYLARTTIQGLVGIDPNEETVAPIYTAVHSNHLMLLPQEKTMSWGGGAPVKDAYIEVVYRIETATDSNAVGYADASNHPNYATLGNSVTGPLFVKVGFKLGVTDFTWDAGKGYTYNIKLGTSDASGGELVDNKYTDKDGNTTDLPTDGGIGDPVSSGNIDFKLIVSDWDDTSSSSILK